MADLSRLIVAGNQAANACDAAPLLVRPYLKPLREFVDEVVSTLQAVDDDLMTLQLNAKKLEIERARCLDLYRGIFNSTPVLEGAMVEIGVPPRLVELLKQEVNAQAAGGSEAGGDQQKEP